MSNLNEQKPAGWFSRRHSTREAHEEAVARHANKEDKRSEARLRKERSDALTPKQRLAQLDERLGKGVGATKERARLKKQIVENV